MRKHSAAILVSVLCVVAFFSCASAPGRTGAFTPAGTGNELTAAEVIMSARTTDVMWDDTIEIAELTPGTIETGVECIEASMYYGETALVWHFTGLTPNAPVEVEFDVLIDFFGASGYIEVAYMPGLQQAEIAYDPREEFRKYSVYRWAAGEPQYPDSTNGWETVSYAERNADAEGNFSMVMIAGRITADPPVVMQYFTNPVARSVR